MNNSEVCEYITPVDKELTDEDETFIGVIRSYPELIRCRECKYFRIFYHGGTHFSYECALLYLADPRENDYCSRAEMR